MPARVISLLILLLNLLPAAQAPASDYAVYLPIVIQRMANPSEQEPNNSRAQASALLASGTIIYGRYASTDDKYDIFYFNATRAGPVRITLNQHPNNKLQLQLHSATSALPLRYDYLAPYQIDYTVFTPGRYYVAIYAPPGPTSSEYYELTVSYP